MKRICLSIVLLIYIFSNVLGQIRFSKFYDYNRTANFITNVVVLGDSGYFASSQCVNQKENDTLSYSKTYLYLIRTNSYGDTLYTKVYHKPRFNIEVYKSIKARWGFLLSAIEFDLKKYHETGLGSYLKLWKIANNGDSISTITYDIQQGNEHPMSIITTNDNGFAVFGQTCNQTQPGKKCNYFLMKLDSTGNKQWHKIYKQSNTSFENPNSVIQLSDGSFYMFGQSTFNGIMKWFLVKTDSLGNQLWQKTYNEYPRQAGMDIIAVDQNKLFLVGGYNSMQNGTGNSNACAMLIDTSGALIWSKSYGNQSPFHNSFTSVTTYFNKLFIVGITNYYDSLDNLQGWLLAVNLNGDSLFQRLYNVNPKLPEHIYAVNKTNDGFLLSGFGFTKIDSINSQDAWMLKVDTFGCLTPGCQLVGIDNIPFSREEIKIYPNPAKNKIQFEHSTKIISYRIADYAGKLIIADNYLESGINIEQLPSGAYIIQVLLENNSQAFGKLIVEK